MTPEDRVVCLCTRQEFTDLQRTSLREICEEYPLHWDVVFETAQAHAVTPLVHANLQKEDLGIPDQTLKRFKSAQIHNIFVKKNSNIVLQKVLDLFAAHHFEIMLVKGEALNLTVYREPWYTVSLDMDIVVNAQEKDLSPDQQHQINSILDTIKTINENRTPLQEKIEYDFHEHHDVNLNGVLPIDAFQTWDDARKQDFHGRSIYIMAPEDMLIAAAVQSLRKRFFKLKPACDIAEIIRCYPDMPWESLIRKAQAYKCNTILYTALIVTQMLLGCDLPSGLLDDLAVNPNRSAVIRQLVRKLYYDYTLESLRARSHTKILGRRVSLPLLLTYATFRTDALFPKLGEIVKGRNKPEGDFF